MRQDVLKIRDAQLVKGCEELDEVRRLVAAVPTRDQLAELGARAMAIAHELRQPLFTIAIASENLRQMLEIPDFPRDCMQKAVARIDEQVLRAQDIIAEALSNASDKRGSLASSDLVGAMRNAIDFLTPYLTMSGVAVEQRKVVETAYVQIGRVRIEQIFVNVLCNAVESIQSRRKQGWSGEGRITIDVECSQEDVLCTISDNGAGLEAGVEQSAFQPFFTTKAAEGTGLGLSICRAIVDSAEGDMGLFAGDSEGAVVEIRLPLLLQRPESDVVAG